MTLRIDHIIVVLVVTILFISGIYLMDLLFSDHHNQTTSKYNAQFDEIELDMKKQNYQHAILLCELIVDEDGTGLNEIKAKAYIGLSQLEMGNTAKSLSNLESLIDKYPGIKTVYTDLLNVSHDRENQEYIYNDILTSYIPNYNQAINNSITPSNIFDSMNERSGGRSRWVSFIFIQIGAIVIYERIRKKFISTPEDK